MNASIVKDIPDGSVVLGVQGKTYNEDDRIAKTLKQKYFGR